MWGGTPSRNMTSPATGFVADFDVDTRKNVLWSQALGSQSYGNPVVGNDVVLVGTNNDSPRDPKVTGDRGVVMAFRASTGEFLWQYTAAKLESGQANDWPEQGIASSPLIDGNRAYFVSNRAVLVCVDLEGFRDGENDGAVKDEAASGPANADVVWTLDMIKDLGVFPHNLANSSPVAWGDLVYVGTSNGHDESHVKVPAPQAPSLLAVDKATGKVVWSDSAVGPKILHGQWSSPSAGVIGGVAQVVSAQGDGWVRGYDAKTGAELWEYDTNPKDAVWPKTRNELIATPVIAGDRVYIGNGQDPEYGEGVGSFHVIDATKRGDVTVTGRVWMFPKLRRTISSASVVDGLVYIADFSGFLYCLEAATGKELWSYDAFAAVWGSPFVVDGRVFLGDEDGDIVALAHGREKKLLFETNLGSAAYGTVTPANGRLYVATRERLFAIGK